MSTTFSVITTIQSPTNAVLALAERLVDIGATLLIIGDAKSPPSYDLPSARFVSLEMQLEMPFELARQLPVGHYTRKNLGYLEAIRNGARCIYETDDDNAPLEEWSEREEQVLAHEITSTGWVNVYKCFSSERIWPRGLPLDAILDSFAANPSLSSASKGIRAPIQQGLANGSPDVDAIWRLVQDRPFDFDSGPSVHLPSGCWCPFNSQSTWWWPDAYPLMYLPSYCSFRMTDIWRSFVAQRCLWELGHGVVFHGPEVVQDRNEHDLMRDFADEIPGYQRNREIARLLEDTSLEPGVGAVGSNLRKCYIALVSRQIVQPGELDLVDAWCDGLERASGAR